MKQTKHTWKVPLMREDGQRVEVTVSAFWDPESTMTHECVMDAARVQTWWAGISEGIKSPDTGKPFKYMPTGDPVLV